VTLVLNCLTRDYLFQVSDRRLMRGTEVVEDNANKNVLQGGGIAFSYTGLAEIEGKKTDEWLLSVLPDSFQDTAKVIVEKATEAFKRMNPPSAVKRHAFAGVGWLQRERWSPPRPTFILISNFHQLDGEELRSASDRFSALAWQLPENVIVQVFPVGQRVPKRQLEDLHETLKRCVKKKKGSTTVMRLLVMAMREIAENNPAVGKNLLALGLPRKAAGVPGATSPLVEKKMIEDENTFLYIPADSLDGIAYGPAFKGKGFLAWDFEAYPPGVLPSGIHLPPIP